MEVKNDVSPLIGGRIIHAWVPDASDNGRLDASVCEYATVEVIRLRRDFDEAFFLGCWFQTQRCAYFHDRGVVKKRFHQLVHNGLVVCPFRVLAQRFWQEVYQSERQFDRGKDDGVDRPKCFL